MNKPWTTKYIFVSSTFLDLKAERDQLVAEVFPRLQEKLNEFRQHLQHIDLRRITNLDGADDEASQERQILKVCLEEIKVNNPFIIVLLGHRYGWVPSADQLEEACREAGVDLVAKDMSVTALEIEYGLISQNGKDSQILFFLREELPFDKMSDILAAQHSSAHDQAAVAQGHAEKIKALRERLLNDIPNRCHSYTASWELDQGRIVNLDEWGNNVFNVIWKALEPQVVEAAGLSERSQKHQEESELDEFLEMHRRFFRGREKLIKNIINKALKGVADSRGDGICVIGEAGSGKSALSVQLYEALVNREDVLLLYHAAGISHRSTQALNMVRAWIDDLAIALGIDAPVNETDTSVEIRNAFSNLIRLAAVERRVIILIDALDQLEAFPNGEYWFPAPWPDNVRLVSTSCPGHIWEHLADRDRIEIINLPDLIPKESELIIDAIDEYRRENLAPEVIQAIIDKSSSNSSLAASKPLWLTMVLDWIHLLDSDDLARVAQYDELSLTEGMLNLILDEIEDMPATIQGFYRWFLDRLRKNHSADWVKAVASLITVSRGGWRDRDFQVLLPRLTKQPWCQLNFASLRRSFRTHIIRRGLDYQLNFVHSQMRNAVFEVFLDEPAAAYQLHTCIADHLLALDTDDAIRMKELIYHLLACDRNEEALEEFARTESGQAEKLAAITLAERICLAESEEIGRGIIWFIDLLERRFDQDKTMVKVVGKILKLLWIELYDALEKESLCALLEALRAFGIHMTNTQPSQIVWYHYGIAIEKKMGDLLYDVGDLWDAEEARQAQLFLAEEVVNTSELTEMAIEDLGLARFDLGLHMAGTGRQNDARDWFVKSSQCFVTQCMEFRDSGRGFANNARTIREVGLLYRNISNSERAKEFLTIACGQCEILFNNHLPRKEWISLRIDCLRDLAEVLKVQSDYESAAVHYEQAQQLAKGLVDREPANPRWLEEKIKCELEIAAFSRSLGRNLNGKDIASIAYDLNKLWRLDPEVSDSMRLHAVALSEIGNAQLALGNTALARESYQQSLKLIIDIFKPSKSSTLWVQQSVGKLHQKLGNVDQHENQFEDALAQYKIALRDTFWILQSDPTQAEYLRDIAVVHTKTGETLEKMYYSEAALTSYACAYIISRILLNKDAASTQYSQDVYVCTENVVRLAAKISDPLSVVELAVNNSRSKLSYTLAEIRESGHSPQDHVETEYWKSLTDLLRGGFEADQQFKEVAAQEGQELISKVSMLQNKAEKQTIVLLGHASLGDDQKILCAILEFVESKRKLHKEPMVIMAPVHDSGWNTILAAVMNRTDCQLIPVVPIEVDLVRASIDKEKDLKVFDALLVRGDDPLVVTDFGDIDKAKLAMHIRLLNMCGELLVVWDGIADPALGSIASAVDIASDLSVPMTWIYSKDPSRVVRESY